MRNTLESAARDAISSACDDVRSGDDGDLVDRVAAGLVARPRSTSEVSEVLRAAAAHGLTIWDVAREIEGQSARTATDVEQVLAGAQVRPQIGR